MQHLLLVISIGGNTGEVGSGPSLMYIDCDHLCVSVITSSGEVGMERARGGVGVWHFSSDSARHIHGRH
jgi:hypothetical protein